MLIWVAILLQASPPPTLDEIMSRVALNQARSQQMRSAYIYTQRLHMRFRRGDRQLAREEKRDYAVAPQPRGVHKTLVHFEGRYAKGGKMIEYDDPGYEYKAVDLDGALMDGFADGFTNNRDSRDGIGRHLFPLTAHEQLRYAFSLKGRELHDGRDVYRIAFQPRPGSSGEWTGEALIDAFEYQPVFVRTSLAHGVPLVIRTVLGSNLRGLGFSIVYRKFDESVWFPVSYGGEFSLRVLFGYRRTISIDLTNTDFRRADVNSTVVYETSAAPRPPDP